MTQKSVKTQCCVVGGAPAGMILGYLLARKWNDFFKILEGIPFTLPS